MQKILTILFLLSITSIHLIGQSVSFSRRYHLNYPSAVFGDVYATDTMYYVTGTVTNPTNSSLTGALFARFDLLGNCIDSGAIYAAGKKYETWENTLRPIGNEFVVNGYGSVGNGMCALLLRYNRFGDTLWTQTYTNPTEIGGFIVGSHLLPSDNNQYYFLSTVFDSLVNNNAVYVMQIDSIGDVLWDTIFNHPVTHYAYGRALKSHSNTNIICYSETNIMNQSSTGNFISRHIYKELGSNNTIVWTKNPLPINLLVGFPNDIIQTQDGGYLVGSSYGVKGQNGSFHYIDWDGYVYKMDSAFNFLWGKRLWGAEPANDVSIRNVFELPDSNIIAIGTMPYYAPNDTTFGFYYGTIFKLSPQGDSLWSRRYFIVQNQGDKNNIKDAEQTPDGGFIICGESRGVISGQPQQQGWLLKLDSMGCLVPGCHITAVDVVQTPDAGKIDIKVFPNPATDYINVYVPRVETRLIASLHAGTPLQLHLYDLNGRLLQNHTLPQSDATYMLTTEGLESGLYLLQVLDGEGRVLGAEKVVVKK